MKINTVAIIGAGAVGAYFIWGLYEKLGEKLWLVAKDERKTRLAINGITINGMTYHPKVKTPEESKGVDLLLISTKYQALSEVINDIACIVDEHTIVMSLLNGVDSEEIIGARIGMEHMLYSFMKIASVRNDNGIQFRTDITPGLFYGEAGNSEESPRMKALAELLSDTGLHFHPCKNIVRDIWLKYAFNISHNLPQAVIGCGVGAYIDSTHAGFLRDALYREVVRVACAKGIDLSTPDTEISKSANAQKFSRYSTLQDLDAKRHTEIDMFSGAMIRMGEELGIEVPYNRFIYHLIKALEEKNDGKFEY